LKRISTANTLVGAIPGALPPLIRLDGGPKTICRCPPGPFSEFCSSGSSRISFAIGWMYREDYARAGFVMLSGRDLEGGRTGRQSIFFTVLLLVVSVTPVWFGLTSLAYLPIALSLGAIFLGLAFRFKCSAVWRRRGSCFSFYPLSSAPSRRARPDQAMSQASTLAPTRGPLSCARWPGRQRSFSFRF
jgi:hypothetical protein